MRIVVAGIKEIDESKFRTITDPLPKGKCDMSFLNKPNGCLWGSTMTPNDYYLSDWLRWVSEENFHIEKYEAGAISFTLKKKAKVCEISSVEDYKNLMHLDVNIRLLVNQINKNISSILNNKKC